MRVYCSNCGKVFNIPDERLPLGKMISFPCPGCTGTINIDLISKSTGESPFSSETKQKERLSGNDLKKKILSNVKDLPSMPQTVVKAREIMANPKSDFQELAELFASQ